MLNLQSFSKKKINKSIHSNKQEDQNQNTKGKVILHQTRRKEHKTIVEKNVQLLKFNSLCVCDVRSTKTDVRSTKTDVRSTKTDVPSPRQMFTPQDRCSPTKTDVHSINKKKEAKLKKLKWHGKKTQRQQSVFFLCLWLGDQKNSFALTQKHLTNGQDCCNREHVRKLSTKEAFAQPTRLKKFDSSRKKRERFSCLCCWKFGQPVRFCFETQILHLLWFVFPKYFGVNRFFVDTNTKTKKKQFSATKPSPPVLFFSLTLAFQYLPILDASFVLFSAKWTCIMTVACWKSFVRGFSWQVKAQKFLCSKAFKLTNSLFACLWVWWRQSSQSSRASSLCSARRSFMDMTCHLWEFGLLCRSGPKHSCSPSEIGKVQVSCNAFLPSKQTFLTHCICIALATQWHPKLLFWWQENTFGKRTRSNLHDWVCQHCPQQTWETRVFHNLKGINVCVEHVRDNIENWLTALGKEALVPCFALTTTKLCVWARRGLCSASQIFKRGATCWIWFRLKCQSCCNLWTTTLIVWSKVIIRKHSLVCSFSLSHCECFDGKVAQLRFSPDLLGKRESNTKRVVGKHKTCCWQTCTFVWEWNWLMVVFFFLSFRITSANKWRVFWFFWRVWNQEGTLWGHSHSHSHILRKWWRETKSCSAQFSVWGDICQRYWCSVWMCGHLQVQDWESKTQRNAAQSLCGVSDRDDIEDEEEGFQQAEDLVVLFFLTAKFLLHCTASCTDTIKRLLCCNDGQDLMFTVLTKFDLFTSGLWIQIFSLIHHLKELIYGHCLAEQFILGGLRFAEWDFDVEHKKLKVGRTLLSENTNNPQTKGLSPEVFDCADKKGDGKVIHPLANLLFVTSELVLIKIIGAVKKQFWSQKSQTCERSLSAVTTTDWMNMSCLEFVLVPCLSGNQTPNHTEKKFVLWLTMKHNKSWEDCVVKCFGGWWQKSKRKMSDDVATRKWRQKTMNRNSLHCTFQACQRSFLFLWWSQSVFLVFCFWRKVWEQFCSPKKKSFSCNPKKVKETQTSPKKQKQKTKEKTKKRSKKRSCVRLLVQNCFLLLCHTFTARIALFKETKKSCFGFAWSFCDQANQHHFFVWQVFAMQTKHKIKLFNLWGCSWTNIHSFVVSLIGFQWCLSFFQFFVIWSASFLGKEYPHISPSLFCLFFCTEIVFVDHPFFLILFFLLNCVGQLTWLNINKVQFFFVRLLLFLIKKNNFWSPFFFVSSATTNMANRTDPSASSIHGTNPQNLIETIVRTRIYNFGYWKEQCFGLSGEHCHNTLSQSFALFPKDHTHTHFCTWLSSQSNSGRDCWKSDGIGPLWGHAWRNTQTHQVSLSCSKNASSATREGNRRWVHQKRGIQVSFQKNKQKNKNKKRREES